MKKIVVLTGAGVSAESGIKTFRDADGLWEGHDVMQVASPQGWTANQDLVLKFYNDRRRQLREVDPNAAHYAIQSLESKYYVSVITQNVDNLHERAGSSYIIHLHGELTKVRCTRYAHDIHDWYDDLHSGDLSTRGYQLRPHIVWFGEEVPMLAKAIPLMHDADIAIIIGTSLQVYPAASLIGYVPSHCHIYYIDPKPHISYELQHSRHLTLIKKPASVGMQELAHQLID